MIHTVMTVFAAITCAMMSAAALHWTLMRLPNLDRSERYFIAGGFFFVASLIYFAILTKTLR